MDITLFVINTVICAIFWLLSRLCCAWIGHLCEASAGRTTRDVVAHLRQGPGGIDPGPAEAEEASAAAPLRTGGAPEPLTTDR